jgi:hypothetical protein
MERWMPATSQPKKKIILHVGHGKTGSSYIQSSLALSKIRLFAIGIDYPDHASLTEAEMGLTTSGNVSHDNWPDEVDQWASKSVLQTLLFSNERLAWELSEQRAALARVASTYDLKVVLFIRNPLSHMTSRYVESIKRFGRTNTIDDHAANYDVPGQVCRLLNVLADVGVETQVVNYSYASNVLLDRFYSLVGADGMEFVTPPIPIVNRSLTLAEIEIQRLFNLHYGQTSHAFVSGALCKTLPNLEISDVPRLSDDGYRAFVERMTPAIEAVNIFIPAGEKYRIEDTTPARGGYGGRSEYVFTNEQLEVLVKSISAQINACASQP